MSLSTQTIQSDAALEFMNHPRMDDTSLDDDLDTEDPTGARAGTGRHDVHHPVKRPRFERYAERPSVPAPTQPSYRDHDNETPSRLDLRRLTPPTRARDRALLTTPLDPGQSARTRRRP